MSILGFALVSTAIAVAIVLGRPVSAWHALLVLAFGVLFPGLSAHAIAMARELRRNVDP